MKVLKTGICRELKGFKSWGRDFPTMKPIENKKDEKD